MRKRQHSGKATGMVSYTHSAFGRSTAMSLQAFDPLESFRYVSLSPRAVSFALLGFCPGGLLHLSDSKYQELMQSSVGHT